MSTKAEGTKMEESVGIYKQGQIGKIKESIRDSLTQIISELRNDLPGNAKKQRIIKADVESLHNGDLGFLKGRGLLTCARSSELDVVFSVARDDKYQAAFGPQPFNFPDVTNQDGGLYGVLSTSKGSEITNVSGVAELGLYWGEHALPDDCRIITINGGRSGVVGMKLPLSGQLSEGRPILLSCGALTTSTVFCAVKDDELQLYHIGQQPGDYEWALGDAGVHVLVDMCDQFDMTIPDPAKVDNNHLMKALSVYDRGIVVYNSQASGKITETPSGTLNFDYHMSRIDTPHLRVGFCYVLLSLIDGKYSVKLYVEDSLVDDGEIVKVLGCQEIKLQ